MFFCFPKVFWIGLVFLGISGLVRAESDSDLVEIASIDPTILIELKYATAENLAGYSLYPPAFKAELRRATALQLKTAQDTLRPLGYGLKVWDAYRPLEAQKALYAVISDPRFVAEPGWNSMHNRGVAVDVTLVDAAGREAKMPTPFDAMSPAASFTYRGKDPEIAQRLALLQRVMSRSGFYACRTEWWHFFSRQWEKYPNIDAAKKIKPAPPGKRSLQLGI